MERNAYSFVLLTTEYFIQLYWCDSIFHSITSKSTFQTLKYFFEEHILWFFLTLNWPGVIIGLVFTVRVRLYVPMNHSGGLAIWKNNFNNHVICLLSSFRYCGFFFWISAEQTLKGSFPWSNLPSLSGILLSYKLTNGVMLLKAFLNSISV